MPYTDSEPVPRIPKILLVDDREDNLLSIEAVLAPDGYQFFRAYSGHQALKILLAETDFAMILMDVKMPILNGFETAALIYERERLSHIPIVFITANNYGDENIFKGYKAGGIDYIFKPINPEVLRAKVALFIDIYKKNGLLVEREQKLNVLNDSLEKEINELKEFGEKARQTNARLQKEISELESFLISSRLLNDLVLEENDMNELINNFLDGINDLVIERKATILIEPLPTLKVSRVLLRPLLQHMFQIGFDSSEENVTPLIKIRSEMGLPERHNSKTSNDQKYCQIIFEGSSGGSREKKIDTSTGNSPHPHVNGASQKFSNSLVICQKIMEQHHGFIDIQNKDGGTAIAISFPV